MSYLVFNSNNMSKNFYFYNLIEDSHRRNRVIEGINKKEDANKLTDIGSVNTNKELKDKLYKIGTDYQIKRNKRANIKQKKLYHKDNRFAEITAYLRNLFNRPTGNFTKEERQIIHDHFEDAYQKMLTEKLPPDVAAVYNSIFKVIYTNPNSIYTNFQFIKEKLLSHEIQHYLDQMYATQKYGRSAANKLLAKASKASNSLKDDDYLSDPMEYNAILVAGNTDQYNKNTVHNDYKNTTQKIIDRAVRGKSTPKITNDMIAAQYPLIL